MSYKKSSGQKFLKTTIVIFIAFLLSRQVTVISRLLSETPHGGSDGYYYESHHHQPSSYNYNNDTVIIAKATHPTKKIIQKDINYDPVQSLWDEYMEQHSEQVLQQEWTDFWKSTSDTDGASSSNNNNHNVSTITLMNHNHHHFSLNGRKFAIGYYSCPLQAGNRLHHFFNSLIWSIVTNRTFLYRYFDYPTCMRITGGNLVLCNASNTVTECDEILQRNSWIPSFNDWKRRYNFQNFTSLSFWSTIEKRPKHRLWQEGISEQQAGIVDSKDNNDLVIEFAQMLGQDAVILKSERKRNYLLSTTEARERARQLFSFGPDYLFGFLFAKSFAFQPSVTGNSSSSTTATISSPVHSTIISTASGNVSTMTKNITLPRASPSASSSPPILIVIHSRHSKLSNDGSNIQREIKCLDRLLSAWMKNSSDHHQYDSSSNNNRTTTTAANCSIYLLSDRPMTLMLLQEHISQQYPTCQAHVAKHDYGTSFRNEHGPYAGIGFYQDLAMVQNGILIHQSSAASLPNNKIGFIGSERRSSSQLVRELMVYHHHRNRLAQQDLLLLLSNANNSSVDEILGGGLTTCYL
eukprot:scaffold1678_cov80-Cylindrotheca_fusiformis.AAC.3